MSRSDFSWTSCRRSAACTPAQASRMAASALAARFCRRRPGGDAREHLWRSTLSSFQYSRHRWETELAIAMPPGPGPARFGAASDVGEAGVFGGHADARKTSRRRKLLCTTGGQVSSSKWSTSRESAAAATAADEYAGDDLGLPASARERGRGRDRGGAGRTSWSACRAATTPSARSRRRRRSADEGGELGSGAGSSRWHPPPILAARRHTWSTGSS